MNESSVRFNDQDQQEFYKELRVRVNTYFKENKLSKHANLNMKIKSVFMLLLYFSPFVLMLTGIVTSYWGVIGLWAIMGLGSAGIGLSIMHDANHGAYSSDERVNKFMGFTLNYLGGYHINWKIQHNVLHHTFTNIDGHDEDIEKKGIVRFAPTQEWKRLFKFQIFYAPILYSVLTLYWVVYKDYDQIRDYHKRGLLKAQGLTFGTAIRRIILYKIVYFAIIIGLPVIFAPVPWWIITLGFLLMHAIGGMILALVFQSAHVIEETEFFIPDENNSVQNNWAVHQLKTTANFAVGNVPLTWFLGGLNHQIEHHLFPTICHVHYPEMAKIVKKTAKEYGIPYHEHKTFTKALRSHFKLLYDLGNGKYDNRHAA